MFKIKFTSLETDITGIPIFSKFSFLCAYLSAYSSSTIISNFDPLSEAFFAFKVQLQFFLELPTSNIDLLFYFTEN